MQEEITSVTMKRSLSQLSEEEILQIAELIKTGRKSYQQILDEFNLNNKASIHRIKKRYVREEIPEDSLRINIKDRIAFKKSNKEEMIKNAWDSRRIIVARQIDVLEALLYCVHNLGQIQDELLTKSLNLEQFLDRIAEEVSEKLATFTKEQEKDKNKLIRDIYKALTKVSQFMSLYIIRIKAMNELRQQVETYQKNGIDIEAKKQIIVLIRAFFKASQKFTKEQYMEYKNDVIIEFEGAKWLFDEYESPKESAGDRDREVENAEYTNGEDKLLSE